MSMPFAIYDILGILFPGAVAVWLASFIWPSIASIVQGWGEANWLSALAVSFAVGDAVQGVAAAFESRILEAVVPRRSKWAVMPESQRVLLRSLARRHYRTDFSDSDFERTRFDLLYSPVWSQMDNYKTFLAKADFSRSIGFLSVITSVLTLTSILGWSIPTIADHAWRWFVISVLLAVASFNRSRFFRTTAEGVVYYSALEKLATTSSPTRGSNGTTCG